VSGGKDFGSVPFGCCGFKTDTRSAFSLSAGLSVVMGILKQLFWLSHEYEGGSLNQDYSFSAQDPT